MPSHDNNSHGLRPGELNTGVCVCGRGGGVSLRNEIHNKMYHLMTFIKSTITCILSRNKNNELLQFITKQKQIYIENNIKIIIFVMIIKY